MVGFVLFLLDDGLDFYAGGRGDVCEVGGWTGQSADQVRGDFNASGGGESSGRVGSRADHESDGDHGNAYSLQHGGLIEHAGGVRMLKKRSE